jgi:hypothetical protein
MLVRLQGLVLLRKSSTAALLLADTPAIDLTAALSTAYQLSTLSSVHRYIRCNLRLDNCRMDAIGM